MFRAGVANHQKKKISGCVMGFATVQAPASEAEKGPEVSEKVADLRVPVRNPEGNCNAGDREVLARKTRGQPNRTCNSRTRITDASRLLRTKTFASEQTEGGGQ